MQAGMNMQQIYECHQCEKDQPCILTVCFKYSEEGGSPSIPDDVCPWHLNAEWVLKNTAKEGKSYKLTKEQCFDLIFKDIMDNENPENFTEEFNTQVHDVIKKIREGADK